MNDDNLLGGVLNQLGQTAKKTVQHVVKMPEEMAKDVGGQVGSAKQNANENKVLDNKPQWASDEERVKFLRDLYGSAKQNSSEQAKKDDSQIQQNKKPTEFEEQIKDKTPEEQKKLMELRNQLHKENYYDPTFNPEKNPPAGREERPAEKVENEKKQEMQDLQEKEEKKPPPLAVVREQNKTEMFRGASG